MAAEQTARLAVCSVLERGFDDVSNVNGSKPMPKRRKGGSSAMDCALAQSDVEGANNHHDDSVSKY